MDIETIYQIPLTTRRQEDFWAWHYEKRGFFSVRSAYRMLVSNKERYSAWLDNRPGKSDYQSEEREWKALWKVQVPSKIKIFLWRLARQSIPSRDVLHNRKMADSGNCLLCGMADSWRHSLLECNMAKCVWARQKDDITGFLGGVQEQDAREWLATVLSSLPHDDRIRVLVTLWAIWYARRKAIYENSYQSPLSTHCFVERFIADLPTVAPKPRAEQSTRDASARWIPPPPDFAKINVDAATSKNSASGSIAAVARDSSGVFLGASSVTVSGLSDPETLEVLACREGLALASDLLLQKVRLTSDCANAVRSIKGEAFGPYGHIVREITTTVVNFHKVEFVHERREANREAHMLARSALFDSCGRRVWLLSPPVGVCTQHVLIP